MQRLGAHTLTLGFALQVLGFGFVMLSVGKILPVKLEIGLVCGGLSFGTPMPSLIKAVIGAIDQPHAGLASGFIISTLQIGAALGVAIIGGIFYGALGTRQDLDAYAHAFVLALGCKVALLALGGVLSRGCHPWQRSACRLAKSHRAGCAGDGRMAVPPDLLFRQTGCQTSMAKSESHARIGDEVWEDGR